MNLLFIHQNMPGQFRHLIPALARSHRVVCLGQRPDYLMRGVGRVVYQMPEQASEQGSAHPFLLPAQVAVNCGQQAMRACAVLANNGFRPDLIVAHPGWGESLYVREVFPDARLLHYCEWFYHPRGADTNFGPDSQQDLDGNCAILTRNAHLLLGLEACDWGMSPTEWQKRQHPSAYQPKISVAFDGIDTVSAAPDSAARLTLPNGRVLAPGDEVVTYVARSLEPYRGFPTFMRALPSILRHRPQAQVVVVGGDEVSYGRPPPGGGTWRAVMQAEVELDPARVHFLGRIPRPDYLRLLQVSAAHVYLTVPFVLSWSLLEAMSCGCLTVASATPPVQEAVADGQNGLLVDFFSPEALADRVVDALANPARYTQQREAARWTALSNYSLTRCLPQQLALLEAVAKGRIGGSAPNA
jgi:glycosyltransferase involved in cell wall biosynthesis